MPAASKALSQKGRTEPTADLGRKAVALQKSELHLQRQLDRTGAADLVQGIEAAVGAA